MAFLVQGVAVLSPNTQRLERAMVASRIFLSVGCRDSRACLLSREVRMREDSTKLPWRSELEQSIRMQVDNLEQLETYLATGHFLLSSKFRTINISSPNYSM